MITTLATFVSEVGTCGAVALFVGTIAHYSDTLAAHVRLQWKAHHGHS